MSTQPNQPNNFWTPMALPPEWLDGHADAIWTSDKRTLQVKGCRVCKRGASDCRCEKPNHIMIDSFVVGVGLNQPVHDRLLEVKNAPEWTGLPQTENELDYVDLLAEFADEDLVEMRAEAVKLMAEGKTVEEITQELIDSYEDVTRDQMTMIALWGAKADADKAVAEPAFDPLSQVPVVVAEPPVEPEYLESTDTLGYLRRLFQPGDWINIQFIHQTKKFTDNHGLLRASTQDNFQFLEKALEPSTPQQLAGVQNEGWNVYVSMNVFTPDVRSRKERDVVRVNSVYVEFDENGDAGLAKVRADAEANLSPHPHFVLCSSPGKYYVIWLVEGFDVPTQKALNKALQVRYGSDPQSVDAARILRLPGTRNLKPAYNPNPVVEIIEETPGARRTRDEFKIEFVVPKEIDRKAAPEKVQLRMQYYEAACENANVDPGTLSGPEPSGPYAGSYNYVAECPAWEEHTNKSKMDGSVWISPSGAISYSCWHTHAELTKQLGAKPGWANFYRPWLEEQARDNGFEGKLKFGDADEVEQAERAQAVQLTEFLLKEADDTIKQWLDGNRDLTTEKVIKFAVVLDTAHYEGLRDRIAKKLGWRTSVLDVERKAKTPKPAEKQEDVVAEARARRPLTDMGNAERLADLFGDDIRYCDQTGKWLTWAGIMWIPTGKTGPQSLMHKAVRAIRDEAENVQDDATLRSKLMAFAKRSESNSSITGAIAQARALPAIQADMEAFDADRYLFNMQNGTYNLETHEFRPHDKKDLITKASPVVYDPTATCPIWLQFLEKSMPDAATRRFLQQAAGYSLTGDASEDCLFLNIGKGRNGKGVFLNTLKFIIGDYALQANFDSFVARKGGGGLEIRSDIARMAGARYVLASENEQETRLAEGLLKTLTGSDTITARKLYEAEQEFLPQFKLFFAVNHPPNIIGTDDGIWSRIHLIRWIVFIKPEERNPHLKTIFSTEEAVGIFNWMIAGLKDYQQHRLVPSPDMIAETSSFRRESDQIQRFFDEKCVLKEGLSVGSASLYDAYKTWTFQTKEFQLKDRQFKSYLESQGWVSIHKETGRMWQGIGLKGASACPVGGNHVGF